MNPLALARLVAVLSDNEWEPLPDDSNTTIRVGDLRELIAAYNALLARPLSD